MDGMVQKGGEGVSQQSGGRGEEESDEEAGGRLCKPRALIVQMFRLCVKKGRNMWKCYKSCTSC